MYSLGLDFGTNSVRALLVDVADGREVATSVFDYPSGEAGVFYDPKDANLARQNPADYVEGLRSTIREVLTGIDPAEVVGVGVDTTGSTPIPVNAQGVPLAMTPEFADNLGAYAWLWKDHTGHAEAAEITALAREMGSPYLAKCGGTYSSEWFWSKILRCRRAYPEVFEAAFSWVELADWVPAYLTGNLDPTTLKRGICAAGHKAMFAESWGGLPAADFLSRLDPALAELRGRLYDQAFPGSERAGAVSGSVAAETGLRPGTPVAVGAFDAHFGAVGAGIRPGVLVKIIGTSTCDCMVHPLDRPLPDIPGLCGIVPGSILPDMIGLEAGQSAVGDIFNWFASKFGEGGDEAHENLTREAAKLEPGESGLLALDWNNGNRTVLVDPLLTGAIVGLTLHTTPAEIYRAWVEATAFGALAIVRRIEEYGVAVDEVINCGGIAEKNPFVMQTYADILDRPMKVSRSAQTCALGSAIFGAVVGGAHPTAEAAQAAMTGTKDLVYRPDPARAAVYRELFDLYMALHDGFGLGTANVGEVMKRLIAIRERARSV